MILARSGMDLKLPFRKGVTCLYMEYRQNTTLYSENIYVRTDGGWLS